MNCNEQTAQSRIRGSLETACQVNRRVEALVEPFVQHRLDVRDTMEDERRAILETT